MRRHPDYKVRSEVVGHRVRFGNDINLFWLRSNHFPLCRSCNSAQCASIEGGFGNPVVRREPNADSAVVSGIDRSGYGVRSI